MAFLMYLSTRKTSFTWRAPTLNKFACLLSAWEKERGRGETKQVDGIVRQKIKKFLLPFLLESRQLVPSLVWKTGKQPFWSYLFLYKRQLWFWSIIHLVKSWIYEIKENLRSMYTSVWFRSLLSTASFNKYIQILAKMMGITQENTSEGKIQSTSIPQ